MSHELQLAQGSFSWWSAYLRHAGGSFRARLPKTFQRSSDSLLPLLDTGRRESNVPIHTATASASTTLTSSCNVKATALLSDLQVRFGLSGLAAASANERWESLSASGSQSDTAKAEAAATCGGTGLTLFYASAAKPASSYFELYFQRAQHYFLPGILSTIPVEISLYFRNF